MKGNNTYNWLCYAPHQKTKAETKGTAQKLAKFQNEDPNKNEDEDKDEGDNARTKEG